MWKDSTKRSYAFLYTLTLLCPGQITALLVNTGAGPTVTSHTQTATAVTDGTNTSPDNFSWLSWLSWVFGESPLDQDVQEANLISSQLDQLINEELGIANESGVPQNSLTIRRRRSPEDVSTTPASSGTVWYDNLWSWMRGNPQDDAAADFQMDQLNQELTNALQETSSTDQNPMAINDKTNAKDPNSINGMTPIEIFKHYMPDGQMEDAVVAINQWWVNPENKNYVRAIWITWKVVAFLTPGLGIIEQINFTIACTKLVWKSTKMYCEGSDMSDITIAVLPDLAYIIFMYRRDEEYVSEHTLKLGQVIDISSMETTDFIKYLHSLSFPSLPEAQEAELRGDVTALLNKYYKQAESMAENQREYMIDIIVNLSKFFAFFKPQGSMKTDQNNATQEKIFAKVYPILVADKAQL